ncbi:MAG: HAD-IA family hydrolase [Bacteroidales bacterium]|nr:HAD-IA family hydrolase [Bacteroidales bacterium]
MFDKLDTGSISPDEFRNEIRTISGLNISDQDIDSAWNAMLLDMPKQRIHLLENAKKYYRTFLLSNTNAIHYPEYSKYLLAEHGYESLSMLFEKQYLSHEIKLRKPNIEAFQHILSENNLKPSETLFFDDTAQHVAGAKKAGLNAYWLDLSKESIDDIFENGVFKESLLKP